MIAPKKKVLFLCNDNSARSPMAEAMLRHMAGQRFVVASAGTNPASAVDAEALATLARHKVPTEGLRPKDVSAFAGARFDIVIALCDPTEESDVGLAGVEAMRWSFADPKRLEGEARAGAYEKLFQGLSNRIRLLQIVIERGSGRAAVSPP